jgi:Spy/CpxP family protein refolding chaperone
MQMRVGVSTAAFAIAATAALSATAAPPRPSADPYKAGLAFAACMRAHGVPHPDPDRNGDFNLTPAQEQRLRAVGMAKVRAADKACFKYLKPVVSTKPLSKKAKAQARQVLGQVRTCVRRFGFRLGAPVVKDLSRGRAFFGFKPSATASPPSRALMKAEHICERRVQLAKKIDAIIAIDRAPV